VSRLEATLAGLNPEQREAVVHADGPLLVLAGAGSGKTRALTHRIAHLIASGKARPSEILAVTFTNKAAREMRERVERLLGGTGEWVWVSTFHSTCSRILRRDIAQLGYEAHFAIYDDSDSLAAIKRVAKALGLSERSHPPRALRSEIDRLKNRGLWPADVARQAGFGRDRLAEIYQRYQTELRRSNALDFGDLLLLTVRLFEDHPAVLAHYQRRWKYLLVDEYQDTNPVQYKLLRLLAAAHGNVCVVGDEDQSIYGFREADIRNILDFERDFPGAAVVRLERNYRSTQPILSAATAVVQNNVDRKGKTLWTERAGGERVRLYEAADDRGEAGYVVGEFLRLRESGVRAADVAIFYRTHAQSRPFEEELLKYNVPYVVVGGTRFYDRAEVKDALAYLRVLANPDDTESLLRIANRPARGIGETTLERVLALAAEQQTSLFRALERAHAASQPSPAAARKLGGLLELLGELSQERERLGVAALLARVLERSGYVRALEQEDSIEAEGRLENLRELLSAAEEFERANAATELPPPDQGGPRSLLDLFLEQVTLLSEADRLPDGDERLALMTVHVAKGLEFDCVFVVGMEEGVFPHFASLSDRGALEEERRLCYVAMTRARERLYLCNATMRRLHGATRVNPPSRFLSEIPAELVEGRVRPPRAPAYADLPRAEPWRVPSPPPRAPVPRSEGPRLDRSEAQWAPDEAPPLQAGMRVEHPVFGAGTLLDQSGAGAHAKVRVRFDRAGIKTMALRFAQLRLVG
jgi:DNA helicase-2/ATP-dependent DNA helicase PcrA